MTKKSFLDASIEGEDGFKIGVTPKCVTQSSHLVASTLEHYKKMTAMNDISNLRKSYERAELNETASASDPMQQFDQWLKEALSAQVPEPNAMTLATVGSDLRPSTRVVLIKGYDARGVVWFTNYQSRKGQQLAGNPFAALQFHWVELERVWCASKAALKKSATLKATNISIAARSIHALALGPAPKAK